MRVLIACEFSGVVREAFRKKGHDAWSCDLEPSLSNSEFHPQENILNVMDRAWDLMIAHPPCTYLTVSGLHWNKGNPERAAKTKDALGFVRTLLELEHIPRICLENPVGCISTQIRKPDQIIQPYEFGHDASKKTCLWLKNLPKLRGTEYYPPERVIEGKPRWANQTDSGQNRLGPSEDRWKLRSVTYQGIADAMAEQWS